MNALEKLKAKMSQNKPKEETRHGMRYTPTHVYFFTNECPFSNFYETPFIYDGKRLHTSEQAFMIEKAKQFDPSKIDEIAKAHTPIRAKQIGRKIQNYNDSVWNDKRYSAMVKVLIEKFRNPELQKILLETGDRVLVEGSPYDAIWGVKLDWQGDEILDQRNWRGQNLLGKALMEVREHYKKEK